MARRPRLELAGVPLHVIQRGNNRAACFHADADRRLYLRLLGKAAARHRCAIHAYVLMSNHVHLLVTSAAVGAVAGMMQDLGPTYVRLFNEVHQRSGTLWEGRYKSSLIDSETYLLTCHRYIELNPVRAGLVEHPVQYRWSSHAHYALGAKDALVTRHAVFDGLGEDEAARRRTFATQFSEPIGQALIERIRVTTNRGWPLGSDNFLDSVEAVLGCQARPPKRGRPFKRDADEAPACKTSKMLI
jgi:putative transposase